jgi:tRNA pseudouridine38-40 synthase
LTIQQRYKLNIAYRGTRYHGWQSQPMLDTYRGEAPAQGHGIPTIQETLARAIAGVVNHPVNLVGSSRTDAGVHAKGQIAHFDTDQLQIPPEGLRRAVNHALPDDIEIRSIEVVAEAFDAIASTTSKRYQYFIWNAPERPIFFSDLAWHRWQKLDIAAIRAAAAHLVGTFDFASFARPGHGRENTVRTIHSCDWSARGPKLILGIEGSGFLWQMIRIIVGTLVEVGLGRTSADDIPRMLAARDRQAAGPTAPPHGLYLQWIKTKGAETVAPLPSRIQAASGHPPLVLRPLRPHYHDAALRVAQQLALDKTSVDSIAKDLRFLSGFVAMHGSRVVGFIAFSVVRGIARIHWIGVVPELHRQGIGRRLLERMMDDLRRAGIGDVRIDSPAEAEAFFRAVGLLK